MAIDPIAWPLGNEGSPGIGNGDGRLKVHLRAGTQQRNRQCGGEAHHCPPFGQPELDDHYDHHDGEQGLPVAQDVEERKEGRPGRPVQRCGAQRPRCLAVVEALEDGAIPGKPMASYHHGRERYEEKEWNHDAYGDGEHG